MKRTNIFLTLLLIVCTWLNALPVSAQVKTPKNSGKNITIGEIPSLTDPDVIFAGQQKIGGHIFRQLLKKIAPVDAADISDAVDAQGLYMYGQFREGTREQFAAVVEKAREASRNKYEAMKGKKAPLKAAPVKPAPPLRQNYVYGNGMANLGGERRDPFFVQASHSPEGEGPVIKKIETEKGVESTATQTKTIDLPDGTATKTETLGQKTTFDGKSMATEMSVNTKLDAISRTTNQKLTEEGKMSWGASFDVCPDAEGVVRGTAKARIYKQTIINTGRDLGAITIDYTLDFKITGYVNDAAEMTHFDFEGTVAEKTFGFDRALDHGLVEDTNGITDGNRTVAMIIEKGTPPSQTEPDQYGNTRDIDAGIGQVKSALTYDAFTGQDQDRMSVFIKWGLPATMNDLDLLMRGSISRWRHYECVDVECVPAKPTLKAGETSQITATTLSKQDLSKVNANQEAVGTENITPGTQRGEPAAVYSLTAPKAGETADIYVTSTSRRGIGLGSWEYLVPKPKKNPPVKTPAPPKPKGDPAWTGSIKAVHTEKQTKEGQPSGRMLAETNTKDKRWEVSLTVLGTRDTSGGIVNNFHAPTEAQYYGSDYNERRYAAGKMGCGKSGIIMSPETQKFEIIEKGEGRQLLLVTISVIGTRGYISFGSPSIQAERTVISKYETNCASYNAVNSLTHTNPQGVSIGSPSFEVEFQIDPAHPGEIQGTKTVVNSDGSETVYSWHLTRGK